MFPYFMSTHDPEYLTLISSRVSCFRSLSNVTKKFSSRRTLEQTSICMKIRLLNGAIDALKPLHTFKPDSFETLSLIEL